MRLTFVKIIAFPGYVKNSIGNCLKVTLHPMYICYVKEQFLLQSKYKKYSSKINRKKMFFFAVTVGFEPTDPFGPTV